MEALKPEAVEVLLGVLVVILAVTQMILPPEEALNQDQGQEQEVIDLTEIPVLEEMEAQLRPEVALLALLIQVVLEVRDLELEVSVVSFLQAVELEAVVVATTEEAGALSYTLMVAQEEQAAQDILIQT